MSKPRGPYLIQPPVMNVMVEDSMDIMILRDTVRRAGSLLGFSPANRAQLASAAASLAEMVLKSGQPEMMNINGIRDRNRSGIQVSVDAPWLASAAPGNVLIALRSKLGELVDEILLEGEDPPVIYLVMWLNTARGDLIGPSKISRDDLDHD